MISALDFEKSLNLSCLIPSVRSEWDIRTPDLNRPGMQFCGFYDFFAFERPQLIGKVEMAYLEMRVLLMTGMACVAVLRMKKATGTLLLIEKGL